MAATDDEIERKIKRARRAYLIGMPVYLAVGAWLIVVIYGYWPQTMRYWFMPMCAFYASLAAAITGRYWDYISRKEVEKIDQELNAMVQSFKAEMDRLDAKDQGIKLDAERAVEELEAAVSDIVKSRAGRTRGRPAGMIYGRRYDDPEVMAFLVNLYQAKRERGELPRLCQPDNNPFGEAIPESTAREWLRVYGDEIRQSVEKSG